MKKHLLLFALLLLFSGAMFGQVATPTFDPVGGEYTEAQDVEISCTTQGAIIFYTTNGEEPDENSEQYNDVPLHITTTTTVMAKAGVWDNGFMGFGGHYVFSQTASATYTITSPTEYTIDVSVHPSAGGTVTGDGTYQQGQTCTLIATPNQGYTFENWTEAGEVIQGEGATYSFTVNSDRTLVANFQPITYNIEYELNGGSVATDNPTTYTIETPTFTLNNPTKTGYTFDGWTGTDLTQPTQTVTITQGSTGDRNYTANWTAISYNITYNLDGGSVATANPTNYTIETPTFTLNNPTKDGYTFEGWTGTGLTQPTQTVTITQGSTGDRSYTAHWTAINYNISVSANPTTGGSAYVGNTPGITQGTYNYNQNCTVHATANSGYTFTNWTENGEVVYSQPHYTFRVTDNRTLVANFTSNPTYTINVSADPSDGGTVTGGGTYEQGTSCMLRANPANGYTFLRWTENGQVIPGAGATYSFMVDRDRTLVAHFQQQNYTISVSAVPTNGGTVTGGGAFHYGDNCTVIATPNNGYQFTNWTENGQVVQGAGATYTFEVTGNRTLVAHFTTSTPNTYNINVSANPTNGGTVTGGGTYQQGANCTVTATANTGYTFQRWTENGSVVSTNASYSFTVTSNRNLVAHFQAQPQTYIISVSANPANGGTVTGGGTYQQGQSCTVHATASSGYVFTNWTENGTSVSTNANYTFNVTGNRTLVANFTRRYTINVSANPSNGGTVTGGGNYNQGASCTVTATANTDFIFTNWTENGAIVSTEATYQFTVTSNRNLVANFTEQFTIEVSANPANGGTATGGGTFNNGESCTVVATAADGYTFENWTEEGQEVSTDANYTFTVSSSRKLVANFIPLPPNTFNINVSPNPFNGGTATGGGAYQQGHECTVTATANPGYKFEKWTEGDETVSTDANYTFQVERNRTLVAQFQLRSYTITVTANPEEGGTVTGGDEYAFGAICTLTATPNPGYTFSKWKQGNATVSTNPTYIFQVTGDASFTAIFTPIQQYTITARANNDNWGSVSGGGQYFAGATCTLHATPNTGYRFDNWKMNGAVVSEELDYTFEVTGNATYTAFFSKMPTTFYTIETTVDPAEAGTVTGGGQHEAGSTIELTATANYGYSFSHWQDNNTDNPREITVTGNATYTAFFILLQYEITTRVEPEESGSVSGAGTYDYGSTITLTATANTGYTFDHWNDGNTDNPRTITVTSDMEFVANFIEESCIEDLQAIQPKFHDEGNGSYILILVYPNIDNEGNANNEKYKYQWQYSSNGMEEFTDLTDGTFSLQYYYIGGPLKNGYYRVRVSKDNNDACYGFTEAYHIENNPYLRIYPNPSRRGSSITVVNDCNGPAQLRIYSTDGRLLHTQTVTGNEANIGISLLPGVYVAYLTNSEGYTKVGKLIIH